MQAGQSFPRRQAVLAMLILVGVLIFVRAPALRIDILNEDEALYAATAAAMQSGQPMYRAGVESKPPGIFYLYKWGFDLIGRYHLKALHALTILWVLATGLFVGRLAARARGCTNGPLSTWGAPFVAALLYYVFTTVQQPPVLATQCELLFSLPLAIAAWLLLAAAPDDRRRAWWGVVLAGALCGAATLIKPVAVSLLGAATLWLLFVRTRWAGDSLHRAIGRTLALWLGFGLAWLAVGSYMAKLGVWNDLVYWTFKWTISKYIPAGTIHSPWLRRFASFLLWVGVTVALWLPAVVAATRAARARRQAGGARTSDATAATVLLTLWAVAALAILFLGGRFFDHYFPAVIPPLAALAAVAIVSGMHRRWQALIAAGTVIPGLLCAFAAWHFEAAMRVFKDERQPYQEISDYVREHTQPNERVFVWGYFPLIYVGANRLPASRFVGCHYLTGYAAVGLGLELPEAVEDSLGVEGGFDTLLAELSEQRPVLFVDTAPADLHHWRRYPLSRYPRLLTFVQTNYQEVATVQEAVIYRRRDITGL